VARSDRMIALDIGASKLVMAEFSATRAGELTFERFGVAPLGLEPEGELDPSAYIVAAMRDLIRELGLRPAPLLLSMSGQAVFPRYVKLPPVSRDKVYQIIQYEAEQNVPFPIDEVVWDYQLIGDETQDDINVMLVAVKTENVKRLTDCVTAVGLEPEIVDVAPMALYNCVRYNYPDQDGCTMVLDIGARSSNLIFIEEDRVFSRSIPVAGNAITQEIQKEFDVTFAEAEALKLEHGMVGLGGVYAGDEDETADRVSKVVRSVVTRMHAEVNRSINFYRSQQNGSPPVRVLLAGGSSTIPHMDTFFQEKLSAEVEHLNPFINVPVGDGVDTERVQDNVHLLGEVVGLGLRRALSCPMEINLMPPELVAKKAFRRRQPFFALAAAGLVLILLCWWIYFYRMEGVLGARMASVETRIQRLDLVKKQLDTVRLQTQRVNTRAESLVRLVDARTRWVVLLNAVHAQLAEGMWLTDVSPVGENGRIAEIHVSGRGFVDKVADAPDKTAIEMLRDRLIATPFFSETTRIVKQPVVGTDAYAREFTIALVLQEAIETR
jgi:type IV pilus assembly protein PilM